MDDAPPSCHHDDVMTQTPSEHVIAAIEATLLPCPHCGPLPAHPELVRSDVSRRWQVFCGPCGSSSGSTREPADAADNWNGRWSPGPCIPNGSAALTTLALFLGNSVADLSHNPEAPRYGFSSKEKQERAYGLARAIVDGMNESISDAIRTTDDDEACGD
jgi:hypothetical protein